MIIIISLYILNRIQLFCLDILTLFLLTSLSLSHMTINDRSIESSSHILNDNFLLFLVPFNPYFLYSLLFIIPLNIGCLYSYFKNIDISFSSYSRLKQYWISIIQYYIVALMLFSFARLFYCRGNGGFINMGEGFNRLFCESYSPFSVTIVSAYLIGSIIFSVCLIFILEPIYQRARLL